MSCKKVYFSLNSWYKRIIRHRGIKFGIFIPIGSTSLAILVKHECMLEVALLCVNLVWIYKLCKHQLYTHCVYCLHCVLKYSKQEILMVAMFVVSIVQVDSFGTRPKKMRISQRLFIRF